MINYIAHIVEVERVKQKAKEEKMTVRDYLKMTVRVLPKKPVWDPSLDPTVGTAYSLSWCMKRKMDYEEGKLIFYWFYFFYGHFILKHPNHNIYHLF